MFRIYANQPKMPQCNICDIFFGTSFIGLSDPNDSNKDIDLNKWCSVILDILANFATVFSQPLIHLEMNNRLLAYPASIILAIAVAIAVMAPHYAAASTFADFIHTYTNTTRVGTTYVDKTGTAWVGTSLGLMKYDDLKRGYDIRLSMPEELRVPIHLIYGMEDGGMVVVTRAFKKYLFNPVTYQVDEIDKEWLDEKGIDAPGPWTLNIISNNNGPVLIESEGKVYLYDSASGEKTRLIKTLGETALSLSGDDRYYHIVTPSRIYTYEFATGGFSDLTVPDEIFAAHVLKDAKGNLWLGDRNLYRYSRQNGWEKLRDNVMTTEITKSESDIYVGTNTTGILHYDDSGELLSELHNDPFDINTPVSDHCAMIYVDSNDNLWVTYSKGDLSISSPYYDLTKVRHIQSLQRACVKDDIISLLPIGRNTVLVGTDGNGLHIVDANTGKVASSDPYSLPNIADDVITAMYLDSRQRLWIGSYRRGLICVEQGRQRRFIQNTSPYSIVEDLDGNIFVGTSGNGLYRLDSELKQEPENINLDGEIWVQKLQIGREGQIYIATGSKLIVLDPMTMKTVALLDHDNGVFSNGLNSFYHDSRSLLWMISDDSDNCLRVFDTENDSIYTIPTLADIRFKSVIEDNNKNMWLTSDNDIYNIVPHYDPTTRTYSFNHYVYHIRSNEGNPNKFNLRSVAKLADGRLLFGGMNGYQIVDPDRYQKLGQLADIKGTLSALKVNNNFVLPNGEADGKVILKKDLTNTELIRLSSDENHLTLLFSPHDYASPFNIEYYYRLEGKNGEWYPIIGNMIELTNLTPGKYHLEVCAMSPEGVMSGEVDGIDIEILSPWYRTVWAYIAYIIILLIIIGLIAYYFIDRQRQKLRVVQAEKEMARQHQLNEMKLRFFTNISHDFRTPLSLIITPLETYLDSHNDADTLHFLQPVHKNAVRLLNLVNQILDFRKLDVTGIPLHLSYGDIVSYVKEICTSFNLFSEDSGIDLVVDTDLESLNMYFDKDKLSKIMMNLLSNAFKYNENGGRVAVSLRLADDNQLKIAVADTGKGIPDGDKPHIFERFFQSGNSQHTTMGCGIGLHIVKEFVQMHGGEVEVTDNSPCGTVFTLTLPVRKTLKENTESNGEAEMKNEKVQLEIPASERDNEHTRATILLVEDNQDFIDFMAQTLATDYNVLKAYNGKEALDVLTNETVDIIISDVMMDQMDGLELCQTVKSDLRTSHIPVILLTAKSLVEDEMKGLESGADDYITKPFSMPLLRQKIAKLIDETRRSRDKFRRIPDIAPSEITITPLDEQFLSDTIKIVEENMANPDFSVESLSSMLGMSRTHLYRKLSGITGKTPIEFIRLLRLKRAAQYLAQSQMYISEIAYKVGFNNPRLLSRYFKEEYNMTPREYVRSCGRDNAEVPEETEE